MINIYGLAKIIGKIMNYILSISVSEIKNIIIKWNKAIKMK